jgi:hypothetical protein
MERSIYHNYPLLVFWEPSCLRELETIMRLGKARAEVILKRKGEPIYDVLKFFILQVGRGKGVRKADFVLLYPDSLFQQFHGFFNCFHNHFLIFYLLD